MGKITVNDYDISTPGNGTEIYRLSDKAVKAHSKKQLAGIPKTIAIHKPDSSDPVCEALAESVCKALAKQLAVE